MWRCFDLMKCLINQKKILAKIPCSWCCYYSVFWLIWAINHIPFEENDQHFSESLYVKCQIWGRCSQKLIKVISISKDELIFLFCCPLKLWRLRFMRTIFYSPCPSFLHHFHNVCICTFSRLTKISVRLNTSFIMYCPF